MRDKLNFEKVCELASQGFSSAEIGRKLNYKADSVFCMLKRNGIYVRNGQFNTDKLLNNLEKSVVVGTMLGDGGMDKKCKNSRIKWCHSLKQKEYALWKKDLFENVNFFSHIYTSHPDKRNGKRYTAIYCRSETNKCFTDFYNKFYINGKKIIPMKLIEKYYDDLSLAIHFMDDGFKADTTYGMATMCFEKEDIEKFTRFLFVKFNLECTINNSMCIRIRRKSANTFKNLIEKYIHEDCRYKL